MSIAALVNDIFNVYFWLIIVRIFLTWIPSIDWYSQPFKSLAVISDIFLEPFKRSSRQWAGLIFHP